MSRQFSKTVEKLVIHGDYLTSAELLEKLIDENTKYLVLDLDKTIHLGHNMGELLGWELCAYASYGEDYLTLQSKRKDRNRFFFWKSKPLRSLKYLLRGIRLWTYPGLFYLFAVRIGMKYRFTRRWAYRLLGKEPVYMAQQVPRIALMHHLTEFPFETILKLMHGLWHRYRGDQVFVKEDFLSLKKKYPNLKIIISSASPQPVLEKAKDFLGVDEIIYSSIDQHQGYMCSPHFMNPWFMLFREPRRISEMKRFNQNSAETKIKNLLDKFPDFLDADVETVGITDTGYGEDHSWAQYFNKLADVNSSSPFSPIICEDSPLREIHSAKLLTRRERVLRDEDVPDFLDSRRTPVREKTLNFSGETLRTFLKRDLSITSKFSDSYSNTLMRLSSQKKEMETKLTEMSENIEKVIAEYNSSIGKARDAALRKLKAELRRYREFEMTLIQIEKPLADAMLELKTALEKARSHVEQIEIGLVRS